MDPDVLIADAPEPPWGAPDESSPEPDPFSDPGFDEADGLAGGGDAFAEDCPEPDPLPDPGFEALAANCDRDPCEDCCSGFLLPELGEVAGLPLLGGCCNEAGRPAAEILGLEPVNGAEF